MRINAYLRASCQNSDPAIRSGDINFLQDRCISSTEWRLLDIFDVFVLLRRMTILTLTFDLLTLRVFHVQRFLLMSDLHTNFYYPTTIGY